MSLKKAQTAIKVAWIAGVIKGMGTLCLVVYSTCIEPVLGIGFEGLVDVSIVLGLSFGIYKRSRTCAVIMVSYHLLLVLVYWAQGIRPNLGLLAALLVCFIYGMRGAFAYHRLTLQEAAAPPDGSPPAVEAVSPPNAMHLHPSRLEDNLAPVRGEQLHVGTYTAPPCLPAATLPVYFTLHNNEPEGPYTIEELRSLWNSGVVTGETFYCEEGYDEWLRLEKMADQLQPASTKQTSLKETQTNLSPLMTPPPLPSAAAPPKPLPVQPALSAPTENREILLPTPYGKSADESLASPAPRLDRPALRPGALIAGTVVLLGAFGLVVWLANKDGKTKSLSGAAVANGLAETKARANKGDAQAQYRLGSCYGNGEGVAKDEVEAVKWFRKAAEQNYAEGQYCLGRCYAMGLGVPQDYVEAVKWCRKAAEQNHALAQNSLGSCYGNGEGGAKDEVEAVKWFRKAAEQNDAPAQNNLGRCYAMGLGVPQDYVEAYKWWNLAAGNGDTNASLARSRLASKMTPGQIAEGQRRSTAFLPVNHSPGSTNVPDSGPARGR